MPVPFLRLRLDNYERTSTICTLLDIGTCNVRYNDRAKSITVADRLPFEISTRRKAIDWSCWRIVKKDAATGATCDERSR